MSRNDRRSAGDNPAPISSRSTPNSRPWLEELLSDYEATGDLLAACRRQDVSFAELHRLRLSDTLLDARLEAAAALAGSMATIALRARAAAGDGRAMALWLKRGPEIQALTAPRVAGRTVAASIQAAATALYWAEIDRLEALARGADPPIPPAILEGAAVCPNCRTISGPWWAGGREIGLPEIQTLEPVIIDAWNYHHLIGTVPAWGRLLPDPLADPAKPRGVDKCTNPSMIDPD